MNRQTKSIILLVVFAVVVVAVSVLFEFGLIKYFEDSLTNQLFCSTVSRVILSLLFVYIINLFYTDSVFKITNGGLKGLMWSVPCFLVAFANFPYTAIFTGNLVVTRSDIMFLYIFNILAIAIYEELVFRAFLVNIVIQFFKNNSHKYLFTILISSGIFAILHAINFTVSFSMDVLLQIGYTFLIGCMLSTLYLYTKNLYLCIGIHAIFDFGGMILMIANITEGVAWDTIFWIITAVCGAFCAAHVVFTVIKMDKRDNYVS